jgi:hypothetical protein
MGFVSQYQQQRIHHYKWLPKDARERTLSKDPIDELLGHEGRAMEKCKLEMKQINKYRDGGTQVSWQEGEPFSLIIKNRLKALLMRQRLQLAS